MDKFSKVYNLVDFRNNKIFVPVKKIFNDSDNIPYYLIILVPLIENVKCAIIKVD